MAKIPVPDRVLRSAPPIFKGDIRRQWAEWFLNTFCDIDHFADNGAQYPEIYGAIRSHVEQTWTEMDRSEKKLLATSVARMAHHEVRRRAEAAGTRDIPLEIRQQLLDQTNGEPFCYICGFRFSSGAVDDLLENRTTLELPPIVDVFKPIGLKERHLHIEVDHLVPFSRAGSNDLSNLRLCCGWCNTHKSNRLSIYEVSGEARTTKSNNKKRRLPQPFWVVRLLALEGPRSGINPRLGELTVALRNPRGGVSPANLCVVRYDDDPMGSDRFQRRSVVAQWQRSTSEVV